MMTRICLAIPSLQPGGMERVMSEIAWDFSKRKDVELHLIMFGRERAIFYDIPANMVIHKPSFEYTPKHRTWFTLRTIRYIRTELKKINPDAVLSFGEFWNNLVLLATLGLGLKIFVSDRSQPNLNLGILQNWLRRKLYPKAAVVIAQTQKAKEIYQQKSLNQHIVTIGNPIRDIQIEETRKREKIILSIGRLINTKHYDRLINTFANINSPKWKLYIVGGDALQLHNSEKYKQQVSELNLEQQVILTGTQKNVEYFLERASIFAFPSSSEGFPNVIGEAMSAGLPVVAYDCLAGPSDMIEDGKNGFLIPVFDDEQMKERLLYLMEHDDERKVMGDYAKESIKKFSREKICQKFYDVILLQTK